MLSYLCQRMEDYELSALGERRKQNASSPLWFLCTHFVITKNKGNSALSRHFSRTTISLASIVWVAPIWAFSPEECDRSHLTTQPQLTLWHHIHFRTLRNVGVEFTLMTDLGDILGNRHDVSDTGPFKDSALPRVCKACASVCRTSVAGEASTKAIYMKTHSR